MPPIDPRHITETTSAECVHCGLPVPSHRQNGAHSFCCNGCEAVHAILSKSGLDATYYKLREASASRSLSSPAKTRLNEPLLDELDSSVFAESHTSSLDGGYQRTHLYLDGVHCAACVWLVERLPVEVAGVRSAHLNLPRARLTLEWNPDDVKLSSIARWLSRFGYGVQPRVDGEEAPETREERRLLVRMGICWALAGNIMLLAFALYSGLERDSTGLFTAARWVSFALAIPSVLIGGSIFFKKAYHSLLVSIKSRTIRHLHMDTPISIGILVGFGSSSWATFSGSGEVWFDSIALLIAALLTARWLQLRARRMAGNSTEQLLALLPTIARKETGSEVTKIRTDDLVQGDTVMVKPGELIPVDGVLVSGSSLINASVLTGESVPLRKQEGDAVFAGTTNETDTIRIRVLRAGANSSIGRLLSWVADDQTTQPVILGWANRIGGLFTVSALLLAVATAILWSILDPGSVAPHVVSLLVITCPCALGMATPLALAVGTGRAARKGIFIKSESVLDWLTKVDIVVLDKTGTLTEGTMSIVDMISIHPHITAEEAVAMATALEMDSIHPIARAFHLWSDGRSIPAATNLNHVQGLGIKGEVEGRQVRVGNTNWIPLMDPETRLQASALLESGKSVVVVEVDGQTACLVSISDPLRSNAAWLLDQIRLLGKDVRLCSGDHQETTLLTGAMVGLEPAHCLGRHTPEMKKAYIESLISEGRTVAMIGDGVNDFGALQAAHVGIAVTDGSAASRFAADAYTTRSGMEAIAELFRESGKVMGVIHRNLAFSLGYNVIGAGLAIAGLATPLLAAVAMPISSLVVVLSSITQRTFTNRTTSR